MKKEILETNKGVTLIALVVTIIVLLILAGISINVLAGQNGLLNRTAESKESTESSQVEENLKLAIMEAMTKGLGKLTDENLKESLNNIGISNDDISGNVFGGWSVDSKKIVQLIK